MNDEDVNRVIAEYMGILDVKSEYDQFLKRYITFYEIKDSIIGNVVREVLYTKSLDALVPVWEKMSLTKPFDARFGFWGDGLNFDIIKNVKGVNHTVASACNYEEGSQITYSLPQGAAYATARAIKEMK